MDIEVTELMAVEHVELTGTFRMVSLEVGTYEEVTLPSTVESAENEDGDRE